MSTPEYRLAAAYKCRDKKRQYIRDAKAKPCADCGVQYPYYVMQFDHLGNKKFTLGSHEHNMGWKEINDEIDKCEVVCGNCHAERSHQRRIADLPE